MWRRRGLLSTGEEPPNIFQPHIIRCRPFFYDIGYDTCIVIWGNIQNDSIFADSMNKYLNQGDLIVAYFDHGSPHAWYHYDTTNIMALENNDSLPVVLSMCCFTANFQWDHVDNTHPSWPPSTCFGEHFLFNPNGGCVAYYGATHDAFNCDWVEVALMRALQRQYWTLGQMVVSMQFVSEFIPSVHCLLGDPALDLGDRTACPTLPDLVLRPRGIDLSVMPPYPYPAGGDEIPIQAKIYNIGAVSASNIEVKFEIINENTVLFENTETIIEIQAGDTTSVHTHWNTAITHPDFFGEIGACTVRVTVDPDNEIIESWEYNNKTTLVKNITLYPNESGWPLQVSGFSQPAIANLDDAGSAEIVYVSADSVYVFDDAGNVVSGWPQYFKNVYAQVLGDINGDDLVEIIAVSQCSIYVYDANGNTMAGWPQNIDDDNFNFCGYPALGNINSDNDLDIVLFASPFPPNTNDKVHLYVYDNDGGQPIYDILIDDLPISTYYSLGPSVADIVSSGNDDIVVSFTYPPDADAGEMIYVVNSSGVIDHVDFGNPLMIPALADLDGDEYADIIAGCATDTIIAYSFVSNDTVWKFKTESIINSSPAIGDIHPGYDGVEVSFGNNAGKIHLRWGMTGANIYLWPYTISSGILVDGSPAIANINGDGDLDIIITANDNYCYALEYGAETIQPFPLPVYGSLSSPVIGDIDGDKRSEIVLASADGYLHVWEAIDCKVPPYTLEWPQFHHNYQRTGLHNWVDDTRGGKPNPKSFSTSTTVSFTLEKETDTKIKIYDEQGEPVKTLVNQTLPSGTYNPVWYGKDDNFVLLPEGIYFIEIKLKNQTKIISVEIDR